MKMKPSLIVGCVLLLAGCATPRTSFAPLTLRLEPSPSGGIRYLVAVNTSGKDLHNVSGSIYICDNRNRWLEKRYTDRVIISVPLWEAGTAMRAREFARTREARITEMISEVEIVGHCDEGYFRETWVNTDEDQLQLVPPAP